MGAQIFLKSGTNKAGKAPLFIYAQHKGKIFLGGVLSKIKWW